MSNPLVSIIIPVYNVEPYIRECIDSALSQTYENIEIILVDDGSTDRCGAICDEYSAKDDRITVIHQKNGGLSCARNTGIQTAKGDYIGFLDGDDMYHQEAIESLLKGFNNENIAVSCARQSPDIDYLNQSVSPVFHEEQAEELFLMAYHQSPYVCNKLYLSTICRNILFTPGIKNEDVLFNFRYSKYLFEHGRSISCTDNVIYFYRYRPDSIVHRRDKLIEVDMVNNLDTMMADPYSEKPVIHTALIRSYVDVLMRLLDYTLAKEEHEDIWEKFRQRLDNLSYFTVLRYGSNFKNSIIFLMLKYYPNLRKAMKR